MRFNPLPEEEWNIARTTERDFSLKRIKSTLDFFSRIQNTCVYMVDYRAQRLILGNVAKPTICGHSIETIKADGFNIYLKILSKNEQQWLAKMTEQAFVIFNDYKNVEDRFALEFSYDLTAKTKCGNVVTLYHRLVPYQLCDNGNMWLALCVVSEVSLVEKMTKACIENHVTGEKFDYINNKFVRRKGKFLTQDETAILQYLADGFLLKQIGKEMGISERTVLEKEKSAFKKLGVCTQAAATHKATKLGLI